MRNNNGINSPSRDLMHALCFAVATLLIISLAGCQSISYPDQDFNTSRINHRSSSFRSGLNAKSLSEIRRLSTRVRAEKNPYSSVKKQLTRNSLKSKSPQKTEFETQQVNHTVESAGSGRILPTSLLQERPASSSGNHQENSPFRIDAPAKLLNGSIPQSESMIILQESESVSIDLATVLGIVGADNWDVQLADEKVQQARAQWRKAKVMWLPSLRFGVGYTGHEGEIQATGGNVAQVSRNSFFLGGGAGLGNAFLTGGAGGPTRMVINLSVADVIFGPKAKKFLLQAASAQSDTVFNDTLLAAATAYYELVQAHAGLAVAQRNSEEANMIAQLIDSFVKAGKGSPADVNRSKIIQQLRQQALVVAQGQVGVAHAKLLQLLLTESSSSDFDFVLSPSDSTPMAVNLVEIQAGIDALIAQGLANRPEIKDLQSRICTEKAYCNSERWRPVLPHVQVGGSAGGFGGGPGSSLPKLDGRADLDMVVAWEIENMGFGTRARRQTQSSRLRQSELAYASMKNQVTAEITAAYHETQALSTSVSIAEKTLSEAEGLFEKDTARIKALEGMPLELIQTIVALAIARENYLDTVTQYNIAQLQLLRAVGGNKKGQ